MAKTQKYADDLLLEAVVKYAEIVKTKIKYTELAKWANRNIPGLEGVRDYHFNRPITIKDLKSGKEKKETKLCTKKIEEINKSRDIMTSVSNNVLLQTSNIDRFFEIRGPEQRRLIEETRASFHALIKEKGRLTAENEVLQQKNKELKATANDLLEITSQIEKKQRILEKQVNYLLKSTDEESRREKLAGMGIRNEYIDIDVYKKSISDDIEEMFDIGKAIREYQRDDVGSKEESKSLSATVMKGINVD